MAPRIATNTDVDRSELVAGYIGQTAMKTAEEPLVAICVATCRRQTRSSTTCSRKFRRTDRPLAHHERPSSSGSSALSWSGVLLFRPRLKD